MSMFISKALRRAEVFLEQVDESVAQASRRLVVEGATGAVKDDDVGLDVHDNDNTAFSRASSIPTAQQRSSAASTSIPFDGSENDIDGASADAWNDDIAIDDALIPPTSVDEQVSIVSQPDEYQDTKKKLTAEQNESNDKQHVQTESMNDEDDLKFTKNNHEKDSISDSAQISAEKNNVDVSVKQNDSSSSMKHSFSDRRAKIEQSPSDFQNTKITTEKIISPVQQSKSHPLPSVAQSNSATSPTPQQRPLPASVKKTSKSGPAFIQKDNKFIEALQAENTDLRKGLENVEGNLEQSRRDRMKLVKNLKRMKEIVSEMDENLREKSQESRQLNDQLIIIKEQFNKLQKQNKQYETKGKDDLNALDEKLNNEIIQLNSQLSDSKQAIDNFQLENERLKQALLQGHEVELATADGARQEASQAHRAYEAEAEAHRQTRQQAKEREENLEEEAALAAIALANAQRKAEECTIQVSESKSAQRIAENKLQNVTQARDAAFARIEDLEDALKLYERNEGNEAPGQIQAKQMQQTISELENALEAKNVELTRLQGEVEALRARTRRDVNSPRTPGSQDSNSVMVNGTSTSPQDVELKMRHMADSALRKQAQLEVLRSENRALQHQLTTERKRTREAQAMAAAASSSRQSIRGGFRGILDGDNAREDRMYGLRDGPLARFRTPRNWPKPIAKLLTGMDRFSAQALAFLRKEPLLRIVLIIYVLALHLFVYTILHWHVGVVSGSVNQTHGRVATAAK